MEVKGGGKVGLVVLVFFWGLSNTCMYVYIEGSGILKKKAFVKVTSSSGSSKRDYCCCSCF